MELLTHPGENTIQTMHFTNFPAIIPTSLYHRVLAIAQHRIQTFIGKKTTPLDPFYEVQCFDHAEEVWRPLKTSIFSPQAAIAAYQQALAAHRDDVRDVRLIRFTSEIVEL